ncbi:hypothetical protein LCGC14_2541450, partial [marine sediment metagenome]
MKMPQKTKYEHIHFEKTPRGKGVYYIRLNKGYFIVGMVEYYKPWKKYATEHFRGFVFDENCHRDIADFLDQLNDKL